MSTEFRVFLDLIRKILKNYFAALSKNKLLLIESLFRFSDRVTKDSILSNYEDETFLRNPINNEENTMETGNNMEDYEGIRGARTAKIWSKEEDRTLIQNYEEFKNLSNAEDHLCLMINNLGFSDKEPIDVKYKIYHFFLFNLI
jgi:hypothetical protein